MAHVVSYRSYSPDSGYRPWRANPALELMAEGREPVRASQVLIALTFALFVSIAVTIYPLKSVSVQEMIGSQLSFLRDDEPVRVNAKQFVAVLPDDRKTDIQNQVRFVLQIIQSTQKDPVEAANLAVSIVKASYEAKYDPLFVASVIKSESAFNKTAVSYAGAKGLMQILPNTGRYLSERNQLDWHGPRKLNDPEYNIQLGISYLKELEERFKGNRQHALIAYNWGPANLSKAFKGTKRIPSSTVQYADEILTRHSEWSKDYSMTVRG